MGDNLARVAFEAYAASTKWRTWDGRAIPGWDDLPRAVQLAWSEAALAVARGLGPKLDADHVEVRACLDAAMAALKDAPETPAASRALTLYAAVLEDA